MKLIQLLSIVINLLKIYSHNYPFYEHISYICSEFALSKHKYLIDLFICIVLYFQNEK